MTWCSKVDYEMLDADMAAARALDTDIIAVVVHWGGEYVTGATQYQTSLADYFFEQGADLVIGGHPHVPAPMELRTIENEDGTTRTGFVCYCLGNLISCQTRPYTDLSAMVQMEITKDAETGEAYISSAGVYTDADAEHHGLRHVEADGGLGPEAVGHTRGDSGLRGRGHARRGHHAVHVPVPAGRARRLPSRIFGTLEMP